MIEYHQLKDQQNHHHHLFVNVWRPPIPFCPNTINEILHLLVVNKSNDSDDFYDSDGCWFRFFLFLYSANNDILDFDELNEFFKHFLSSTFVNETPPFIIASSQSPH